MRYYLFLLVLTTLSQPLYASSWELIVVTTLMLLTSQFPPEKK